MADNYHIDKNSKLFQKFLNLKTAKTNETISPLERTQSLSQPEQQKTKAAPKQ